MGKVTTYLTPCPRVTLPTCPLASSTRVPCHLAHVPTQFKLIISSEDKAADRPCGIDGSLENCDADSQ